MYSYALQFIRIRGVQLVISHYIQLNIKFQKRSLWFLYLKYIYI